MPEKKFDLLVDDIERQGLLEPLIVNKRGKDYFILAGHNRRDALILLRDERGGKSVAPCIVKENLTDNDCELIVQSTNLNRRNFEEMSLKEKCENIHLFYDAVEIWYKEHKDSAVRFRTREEVGNRLNMGYKVAERYNRIYETFKENEEWYDLCPEHFDYSSAEILCSLKKENLEEVMEIISKAKIKINKVKARELVEAQKDNLKPKELAEKLLIKERRNNDEEEYKIPSISFKKSDYKDDKNNNLVQELKKYSKEETDWLYDGIKNFIDIYNDVKKYGVKHNEFLSVLRQLSDKRLYGEVKIEEDQEVINNERTLSNGEDRYGKVYL